MYIEKIIAKDGVSIDDKFNTLTSEQQIELLNEIETKRNEYKEKKIVAETKIKSLQESKDKILEELKSEHGLNSLEEAEKKIAEINDEIISALKDFSDAQE